MATIGALVSEALWDEVDPNKTINTLSYSTLAKKWMNEALRDIGREVRLPGTESVVTASLAAGASTLDTSVFGALVQQVLSLSVVGRPPLTEVLMDEFDGLVASTGEPTVYGVFGTAVFFYPKPRVVTALTARVRSLSQDIGGLGDAVSLDAYISPDFQDLLVSYARAKVFAMEDDFEASGFYRAQWLEGLARMRYQVHVLSRGRGRQTRGMMPVTRGSFFRVP